MTKHNHLDEGDTELREEDYASFYRWLVDFHLGISYDGTEEILCNRRVQFLSCGCRKFV
jgi:hypothetical protein